MDEKPIPFEEYERYLALWLDRLHLVDALLEKPAITLMQVVRDATARWKSAGAASKRIRDFTVPTVLRERGGDEEHSYLVHVTCCTVVQRLQKKARRLPWLDGDEIAKVSAAAEKPFRSLDETSDPRKLVAQLKDEVFGAPNPLAMAETFWLLINSGEMAAHAPLGFFSFFALLWVLRRHVARGEAQTGVAIDQWRPSAIITAKCLMPLERLTYVLRRRAELYRSIGATVRRMTDSLGRDDQHARWKLAASLEELSARLHEFAEIAPNPEEFHDTADNVSALARPMTPQTDKETRRHATEIATEYLRQVVARSGDANDEVLTGSSKLLLEVRRAINEGVFAPKKAARNALHLALTSLSQLRKGAREARSLHERKDDEALRATIESLAARNELIADLLIEYAMPNVRWLRRVVTQEIAFASAGNETDFDAAELLSALTIVERWLRISDLEVEDGIRRSLTAARIDGSWSTGQPMLLKHRVLGVWPNTPETVWLLTMAVERKKKIRDADEAIFKFVQWLDKTKVDLNRRDGNSRRSYSGWPSEAREHDIIDLWSTALAVNSLLGIRTLIEHRLWELCQHRFHVSTTPKSLWEVDPVDVGARHEFRLHRRLMRMARETRGPKYGGAEYSLILHGPPGASKTAIAEALAGEMWKGVHREQRLIRITPADFTRKGGERIDSEARFIFDLLSHIRGVTIFFDEIDDLLQKRRKTGQLAFLNLIVPAMLNRLQDLRDAAPRQEIAFFLATNYIESIEPALTRPGRIDSLIPVPYPDPWSRENILEKKLRDHPLRPAFRNVVIEATKGWPWSTFNKLCKELKKRHPYTKADLESRIQTLVGEFESADAYYASADRWTERSQPLVNEFVHTVMSLSKSRDEGLMRIDGVAGLSDARRAESKTRFGQVWQREGRDSSAPTDPAPSFEVGSAEESRPGMHTRENGATFRVWAPYAYRASIAGPFNNWSWSSGSLNFDEETGMHLRDIDRSVFSESVPQGEPDGQYKLQLQNSEIHGDLWRNDPYAAELFATPMPDYWGRPVTNSVAARDYSWKATPYVPAIDDIVIYQIDPSTFAPPCFRALIDELPYLATLGVNVVDIAVMGHDSEEFNRAWGYNPAYPFAIMHDAGGADGFCAFVDAAHAAGIAVIFGLACARVGSEGDDLWRFDGWGIEKEGGIYYGGSSREKFEPDFDQLEVRNFFYDNARRWLDERRIGGFRWVSPELLAVHDPMKHEYTGWDLMRDVNRVLRDRSLISVAEDITEASEPRSEAMLDGDEGAGCTAQWSQRFMQVVHQTINVMSDEERNIDGLARLIDVRDEPGGLRRVVYSESYQEARKGRVPRFDSAAAQPLALLGSMIVLTSPGIPMLFQGQEFFDRTQLTPNSRMNRVPQNDWMAARHRELIHLRRNCHALRGEDVAILVADDQAKLLAFRRGKEDDAVLVAANFRSVPARIRFAMPAAGEWRVRFASTDEHAIDDVAEEEDGMVALDLGGYEGIILSQDDGAASSIPRAAIASRTRESHKARVSSSQA